MDAILLADGSGVGPAGVDHGVVADRSGLPIGAAVVHITNNETGLVRNLVTDDAGRYSRPAWRSGNTR